MTGVIRAHEGPNHFADLDEADASGDTLIGLFRKNEQGLTAASWNDFYTSIGKNPKDRGLLPFRVAQLYQEMVSSLKKNNASGVTRALCAGGVMAHYVGDACQPLHASKFHDGRNDAEKGVHSDYETKMVDKKRQAIITGLPVALKKIKRPATITGTSQAAIAVGKLMDRTIKRLSPENVCDAWLSSEGDMEALWALVGPATLENMADGAQTLAMIWESAWNEAGAAAPKASAVSQDELKKLYLNPEFVPSMFLPTLIEKKVLK